MTFNGSILVLEPKEPDDSEWLKVDLITFFLVFKNNRGVMVFLKKYLDQAYLLRSRPPCHHPR